MSNSEPARLFLRAGRDSPVRRRHHPWIYRQAVDRVEGEPEGILQVLSSQGECLGWAHYSAGSLIAARMISFQREPPDADWLERRIAAAWELRERLAIDSDAIRIVNAEGDFLPGLILDLFGQTAVLSAHTRAMEAMADRVADCLLRLRPGLGVFLRRDEHFARVEGLQAASGFLRGSGTGSTVIHEGGVPIKVDFAHGQKTGFYLDQRANRTLVAGYSRQRSLLNLFCYSGAASLRAAAEGATRVISVDSSKPALQLAAESASLGSVPAEVLEWVNADVFAWLESAPRADVVVADPPPFARRRIELEGAIQGYLSLFTRCLQLAASGGIAFLFSCSGAVDRPRFHRLVEEAAQRSGRSARLLRELHADVDHPVCASHPEGEYLKGWMVHVA